MTACMWGQHTVQELAVSAGSDRMHRQHCWLGHLYCNPFVTVEMEAVMSQVSSSNLRTFAVSQQFVQMLLVGIIAMPNQM